MFEGAEEELGGFAGYAPIQILALVALELEAVKEEIDGGIYIEKKYSISAVAEFLVKNGARISLELPQQKRLRRQSSTTSDSDEKEPRKINMLSIRLDTDKQTLGLLGGEDRLQRARKEWTDQGKVPGSAPTKLLKDDKASFNDTNTAGGSDSMSCAICWTAFGTLMNCKNKCRVSRWYVCDDCSTKRIMKDGTEHRVSDGQFLLEKLIWLVNIWVGHLQTSHSREHVPRHLRSH